MRAVEIACGEMPRETDLAPDEDGGYLGALQDAVGGSVEAYDAIFGGDVVVWCNENGIYGCPPNRAVYATKQMEEAGYLAQDDLGRTVREGELYSVLFGDLVATGFDWETGEERDLTDEEISTVMAYFSDVSGPESGVYEVLAAALSEEDVEANPPLADQASALTHSRLAT